jgi:hypothetical protein
MPEELWAAAVAVAREQGVYAAARGLRVNYDSLKARMGQAARADQHAAPTFVELSPTLPMGGSVVELASAGGQKLTIRLGGGGEINVAELCREFWSHGG